MNPDKKLIKYLENFITRERNETINEVLDKRTRYLTVVLEDIYTPHNASAVLRSCDGFGIQDIHIIENKNKFSPKKGVTIGADQWMTLHHYKGKGNNTEKCYKALRNKGYNIMATSPHAQGQTIDALLLQQKTALVFGAELTGLSDWALEHADGYAKIPMKGFSESFNISVGAAICLYELSGRMRGGNTKWQLSADEKSKLKLEWLKTSIRSADRIIERFQSSS